MGRMGQIVARILRAQKISFVLRFTEDLAINDHNGICTQRWQRLRLHSKTSLCFGLGRQHPIEAQVANYFYFFCLNSRMK